MATSIRVLGAAVVLAAVVGGCTAGASSSCGAGGASGDLGTDYGFNVVPYAPGERPAACPVTGENLRGGAAIEASLLEGRVAVVNFWGSWCGPCRKEEPILEAVWQEYGERGVVFVGVNTRRDQRAAAIAFLDEFGVTYPSVYDPASTIAHAFGVRAMPTTFVIDAEGRVAAQILGAVQNEVTLRKLLDEELQR